MYEKIRELDESGFDKAIEGAQNLVIVEFYTDTCVHCAAMAPVYDELSKELEKYAVFARMNSERHLEVARRYGVMGTPTFKFFCRSRPIGEIVGEINETILRNTIKDFVRHRNECATKSTPIIYEMDGYG